MKITFVISSLSSGGAERVLSLLANSLSKEHEIYVLTFSNDEPFYELYKDIKHIKLNLLMESKSFLDSIKNSVYRFIKLKKELKKVNADVNISFMTHTNILSVLASKLNHQKIMISERIAYDFYNDRLLNFIRKIVYRFADMLVVQTYADKQNYTFLENVEVIYNPLKLPKSDAQKEKIILAVGRFDKQKGFDKLIDAFSKIDSKEWKLCIAGDGKERESLLDQIERLKLKNVELIGKRKDIFEWYAKSSIFILSSQKEGFPNVLLEAMGSGCVCISFDCPYGPSEMIENGINGILVENQNVNKLSQEMQRLVNDEKLKNKLSSEAIKVVSTYKLENIVAKWQKNLRQVIND